MNDKTKAVARAGLRVAGALGANPYLLRRFAAVPRFLTDLARYRRANDRPAWSPSWIDLWPVLTDFQDQAGVQDRQYFYQDLWAARRIHDARPAGHVDVGSRIDGFIAHLLCFMDDVTVIDVRPLDLHLPGLRFVQDDATRLDEFADRSVPSLSSLHAAEHFGLGRYGDPIDPVACFDFMGALQRVLAPGGRLYFSVPVGRERVQFNAHRVFAPTTILNSFRELTLVGFAAVDDAGGWHPSARPEDFADANASCGMFEFTRAN